MAVLRAVHLVDVDISASDCSFAVWHSFFSNPAVLRQLSYTELEHSCQQSSLAHGRVSQSSVLADAH